MSTITTASTMNDPAGETPGALVRLEHARHERRRFQMWLGLASFLAGALVILAVFMAVDWMWVVPVWVRALALPLLVGMGVFLLVRSRRRYTEPQAAVDAEQQFPELGQRLRTVLQYADPAREPVPASPGLLRALVRQTDAFAAALDFRRLIPWPVFERRAIGLVFATIIGIWALLASPALRTAALRMLFLPVHYTTMKVEPGDLTLKAGESLELAVTLEGRPVQAATWLHRKAGAGEWTARSLAPAAEPGASAPPLVGRLTASLADCQEDVEYRVIAGEVQSQVFRVKVVHPLLLKKLQATIIPPSHTRLPRVVATDGNWRRSRGLAG